MTQCAICDFVPPGFVRAFMDVSIPIGPEVALRRVFPLLMVVFAFACRCNEAVDGDADAGVVDVSVPKTVDLKILSVTPNTVAPEGGTPVEVTVENGCAVSDVRIALASAAVSVRSVTANVYFFEVPAHPVLVSTQLRLTVQCLKPATGAPPYGRNSDDVVFVVDPALSPGPAVGCHSPEGPDISVLASAVVCFTKPVDPATVTNATFSIVGVAGKITKGQDDKQFRFQPDQQLAYGTEYTVKLVGGASGVRSRDEKALDLAGADALTWTFKTRGEGGGGYYVEGVSGGGFTQGRGFKNFAVVAPSAPVGMSSDGSQQQFLNEAGFIPLTDPH